MAARLCNQEVEAWRLLGVGDLPGLHGKTWSQRNQDKKGLESRTGVGPSTREAEAGESL